MLGLPRAGGAANLVDAGPRPGGAPGVAAPDGTALSAPVPQRLDADLTLAWDASGVHLTGLGVRLPKGRASATALFVPGPRPALSGTLAAEVMARAIQNSIKSSQITDEEYLRNCR